MGPKQETPQAPQQPPQQQGRPSIPRPSQKWPLPRLAARFNKFMDQEDLPEDVRLFAGPCYQLVLHGAETKAAVKELVRLREADLKEISETFEQILALLKQHGIEVPEAAPQGAEGAPQEGQPPQGQDGAEGAPAGAGEAAQATAGPAQAQAPRPGRQPPRRGQ